MSEILFLDPKLKNTIWGGQRLKEFGFNLDNDHVGECWAISAHPNGDGTIKNGTYKGEHLSKLWDEHRELFGNAKGDIFPLLVKILDAQADLSIQVHPDDAYAKKNENGALGKTECWYVLDCDKDATIVIGHNAKDHAELESMIKNHQWKEFIREIPIKKGDFFQINPGTLHAIKGGTLILETQQSSDITYRVYDYDRLQNGKLRDLHVQQSIDVITAPFKNEKPPVDNNKTVNTVMHNLVTCKYFSVWTLNVNGKTAIQQDQPFMLFTVTEGSGKVDNIDIKKGDSFILPYNYGTAEFEGKMEFVASSL